MHIQRSSDLKFGLQDQELASLRPLTEAGYRDPGVYTQAMGVNLRDQVRLRDPIPLQFKYEI